MDPAGRIYRLASHAAAGALLIASAVIAAVDLMEHAPQAHPALLACLIASGALLWAASQIRPDSKQCCAALERAAYIDPMTGQRNLTKFLLDADAELACAKQEKHSVAFVNIKGFSYVNDIFGRDTGDQLIRYFADYVAQSSLPGEVYGRVGAASFAILGTEYNDRARLAQRYDLARAHLAAFPPLAARGYKADMRAGIYRVDAMDGALTVADMLERAAIAEKSVRATGGDKVGFFTSEMREQWRFEADLEARLESALKDRKIEMYLQPKVDIQHQSGIVGMEALARWTTGDKTLAPSRFIPVLEKTGSIYKLDRYIIEEACRFYRESGLFQAEHPPVIGVNVSRMSVLQPDFLDVYAAIKREYGIPDRCIELEFTESVAMDDRNQLPQVIDRCHEAGFLCSMDDFGSGFSSLNVLKAIRVDVLKLDGEFFNYGDNPERGRAMVESIIGMARAMGIKIVAEGIESQHEVELLREMGCDAVQGYVFAKPMPAAEFLRVFRRANGKKEPA